MIQIIMPLTYSVYFISFQSLVTIHKLISWHANTNFDFQLENIDLSEFLHSLMC